MSKEKIKSAIRQRLALLALLGLTVFFAGRARADESPFAGLHLPGREGGDGIHRNAIFPFKAVIDDEFSGAFAVHAADLDGDGDYDIVGGAASSNDVAWWENTAGDATVWEKQMIDGNFSIVRAVDTADVDGDDDLDVLAASIGSNSIAWWENLTGDGSSWSKHDVGLGFSGAFWSHAADVDGDGDIDVLGAAFNASSITWWENVDGSGLNWDTHNIDNNFDQAVGVYTADFDGDGDRDVVGAAYGGSDITWWENRLDEGEPWVERPVDPNYAGAVGVYAADIDGDGDQDVVGAANGAQEFTWWENVNGDGAVWTRQAVGEGFGNAEGVYAADLDNDGDMDILGAAQIANTMAWWENLNGDGSTWAEHIVDDNFNEAVSVYAADLDGDGDLEMLGAAAVDNAIAWWDNRGGQFGLATTDSAPAALKSGAADDVLQITFTHNGRAGDQAAEWASVALLLEETAGDPLSTAEANALLDHLHLYLDDGSGTFEAGSDSLVYTLSDLTLDDGVQVMTLPDGDANLTVEWGTPRSYFVVVELTAEAHQQTATTFRVTHLTEGATVSTAEDADLDLPLTMAYAANVASGVVTIEANLAPTAADDSYTTGEGVPLVVPAPGVLANDGDADADPLTAVLLTPPAHGTLQLNPDGSFTYTPTPNFSGSDSFTYEASDGVLEDTAVVTITVESSGYVIYLPAVISD